MSNGDAGGVVLPASIGRPPFEPRCWRRGDARRLGDLVRANLDHLRPWMPWIAAEPLTLEERRDLIESWEQERRAGGDAIYAIVEAGAPVGGCGLHRRLGPGAIEIGYWVDARRLHTGVASRAARLLIDQAFEDPEITHVEIHHDRANRASAAVARRLGFTYVGDQPDQVAAPGEEGIDCTWRLTSAERSSGACSRRE
jgi:RimJ/RimL family protein N-acetyltransferase